MNQPVLGIIGGGQLGSMLSEAAKKVDIKTVVLSDDPDAPAKNFANKFIYCLLYTSPSPRDLSTSRMPSSA